MERKKTGSGELFTEPGIFFPKIFFHSKNENAPQRIPGASFSIIHNGILNFLSLKE